MNTHARYVWIGSTIVILIIAGAAWYFLVQTAPVISDQRTETPSDEVAVRSVVTAFGGQLQKVSLEGPDDQVRAEIQTNFSPYVSSELLQKWLNDMNSAPGRLTSSPYPVRIEIESVMRNFDGSYTVQGEVIEKSNDTPATSTYPTTLTLRLLNGSWKITAAEISRIYLDENGQEIIEVYKG